MPNLRGIDFLDCILADIPMSKFSVSFPGCLGRSVIVEFTGHTRFCFVFSQYSCAYGNYVLLLTSMAASRMSSFALSSQMAGTVKTK